MSSKKVFIDNKGTMRVGRVAADKVMLPIYIHLDAAHRGQGNDNACNQLAIFVVTLQVLSSFLNKRGLYDVTCDAYTALHKASKRPGPLAFTTGEYKAIRSAVNELDKVVHLLEWKSMIGSHQHALSVLRTDTSTPLYVD